MLVISQNVTEGDKSIEKFVSVRLITWVMVVLIKRATQFFLHIYFTSNNK